MTVTCIGCGCTDQRACEGGCHWLRVDTIRGVGVCSACQPYVAAWDAAHAFGPPHFDLVAHIRRQREFSLRVFGPGHTGESIRKAATAIQAESGLDKWAGLVMAILDGAWRAGHEPDQIALAIAARLATLEKGFPGIAQPAPATAVREAQT